MPDDRGCGPGEGPGGRPADMKGVSLIKGLAELFRRPICRVDIATGEGFCRLREFWESRIFRQVKPAVEEAAPPPSPTPPGRPVVLVTAEERRAVEMMSCEGWTIREKVQVRAWLEAGMDCRQIARMTGRDVRSVAGVARQLKVLDEHIMVLALAARGEPDGAIADALGMGWRRVASIRMRYAPAQGAAGERRAAGGDGHG